MSHNDTKISSRMIFAGFAAGILVALVLPSAAEAQLQYFAVTPCRVADTRNPNGLNGGPVIDASTPDRDFQIQGRCNVPVGAKAVSLNATITSSGVSFYGGWFAFWPSGGTRPLVSTINFSDLDTALANGAIVPLSTNSSDLSSHFGGSGLVHLIIDVTGYYQ